MDTLVRKRSQKVVYLIMTTILSLTFQNWTEFFKEITVTEVASRHLYKIDMPRNSSFAYLQACAASNKLHNLNKITIRIRNTIEVIAANLDAIRVVLRFEEIVRHQCTGFSIDIVSFHFNIVFLYSEGLCSRSARRSAYR